MKIILPAKLPSFLYYHICISTGSCKVLKNGRLVGALPLSLTSYKRSCLSQIMKENGWGYGLCIQWPLKLLRAQGLVMWDLCWECDGDGGGRISCSWNSPLLPSTLKSKARQIVFCVILILKANAMELFPFHGHGFPFPGPHRGCPRRIQSGPAGPAFMFSIRALHKLKVPSKVWI